MAGFNTAAAASVCLHCAAESPLSIHTNTHTCTLSLPSSQDFQLAHTHKCILTTGVRERKGGTESDVGVRREEGVMKQKLRER